MPLVFRSMLKDSTGLVPRVGNDAESLGVRVAEETGGAKDITVVDGLVCAGREGMSVSPSMLLLPPHRVPKRFDGRIPQQADSGVPTGKNKLVCWMFGEGAFEDGFFAVGLMFMTQPPGPSEHGVVAPEGETTLVEYRRALASTQPDWKVVPWPWEDVS